VEQGQSLGELGGESLFAKYITQIILINCYNDRLPVEALAHRSWLPIQKKHNLLTEKSAKKTKKRAKVNDMYMHKALVHTGSHYNTIIHNEKIIYSESYCSTVCSK